MGSYFLNMIVDNYLGLTVSCKLYEWWMKEWWGEGLIKEGMNLIKG